MNIFVLDTNPVKAAQYHCDKHCIKMILEHTQMLSTAVRVCSHDLVDGIYKIAHLNHPCSKWVRQTRSNFLWLCDATEELFKEYTRRYGKQHKSYDTYVKCRNNSNYIPIGPITEFAQAMPDEYKNSDPVTAYRTYYLKDKKEFSTWKMGNTPDWWIV
jgi:hypothetical protein